MLKLFGPFELAALDRWLSHTVSSFKKLHYGCDLD